MFKKLLYVSHAIQREPLPPPSCLSFEISQVPSHKIEAQRFIFNMSAAFMRRTFSTLLRLLCGREFMPVVTINLLNPMVSTPARNDFS